jgi:transposase-like protein
MMRRGRPLVIAWRDEAATLFARYQQEPKPDLRPRWHALWLLRTGRTVRETARVLGVQERSVQHWIAWYRAG